MAQDVGITGGTFHGEIDRYRESRGWTTACSSMPERDEKSQGKDIPEQAGLVLIHSPQQLTSHKCANVYSLGVRLADGVLSFAGVRFVLFCFVFVFFISLKPWHFVQSFFDMHAPRQPHAVT